MPPPSHLPKPKQPKQQAAPKRADKVEIGLSGNKRRKTSKKDQQQQDDLGYGDLFGEVDELPDLSDVDSQLVQGFASKIITPPVAESAFRQCLTDRSAQVSQILTDIKAKKRSAMRRTLKQEDPLYLELSTLAERAEQLQKTLKCFLTIK